MSDNESGYQPSPPGSSSGSGSQRALDSSSAAALTRAMEGVRHALDDIKASLGAQERTGRFRERAQQHAIEKMTAAVLHLSQSVDRAVKLNREVARSGQQELAAVARTVKEEIGEFKTLGADDEITGQHIKLRWSTVIKYGPVAAKVVGLAGLIAAAVWRLIAQFIHLH
jgi:hypothetical protein